MNTIRFSYKNYKGEVEERNVRPLALEYLTRPGYGYEPGIFLRAFDIARNAVRSFRIDERFQLPDDVKTNSAAITLYAFPSDEQVTLSSIMETVKALEAKVVMYDEITSNQSVVYFYRNNATPDDPIIGPVTTLPDIVRINHSAFSVWSAYLT
jgi:predicted DNA-binding transcriptional regulator YafY